ncbi:MAG: ATP-binding protein [Pseudomonadota bacterium]
MFGWLKRYMPRGLYGRAALIVALPFLALQIIVSVVFIQRHFEDVTRQMVNTTSVMISEVLRAADETGVATAHAEVATPLGIRLSQEPLPEAPGRLWYDISGLTIISRMEEIYDLRAIDLSNIRQVEAWIAWQGDVYRVAFGRPYVSARNPHQLLVLMLVAGAVMIFIAFIYLRNQLRPIRRLAAASEAFGRGSIVPYTPSGATEVRAAGSSFLAMRARIERQIEQRTLMLSGVSHDLRTPLTRMRLALSMMDEPEAADMRRDVDDMNGMIDAFLEFARVGAAEEMVETDLGALIGECIEDVRRMGRKVDLAGALPELTMGVRPIGLKRSVTNLLSNAARYGKRVRLSCEVLERSVRIRVEDDGPGIPEAEREAATRPFTRLDPARGQNEGGSVGLGLAIAADTARRHGGMLRLGESEELGGLSADLILAR